MKKLMAHCENVNSIEVEAPKLFDRMACRFNVDYAFYKTGPAKYLLFFKAGQADAITACFERYSRRLLEQSKSSRIPIREQLKKAAEQLVKEPLKTQERTKAVSYTHLYHSFMMFKNGVKSLDVGFALSTPLLTAINRTPLLGNNSSV